MPTTTFVARVRPDPGRRLLRHHARAPARTSSSGSAGASCAPRRPRHEPRRVVAVPGVPFRQDTAYLSIGERTNANGSKAFREAMLERATGTTASRSPATRSATAPTCSTSASTTSAATASPTCASSPAGSRPRRTLPIVLDSTEPAVLRGGPGACSAGARRQLGQLRGRRRPGLAVRPDHAAGRRARRRGRRLTIDEEGQARTAEWKVRVAERLIDDLTGRLGDAGRATSRRLASPSRSPPARRRPAATASRPSRRSASSRRAIPDVQTTLGLSNISFGLKPAARQVLNSVFLHECVEAGLDSAIVHAVEDPADGPDPRRAARRSALDLVYDRRVRRDGARRPAAAFLELFEGVERAVVGRDAGRGARRRCRCSSGSSAASSTASARGSRPTSTRRWPSSPALEIVNDTLLAGMKVGGRAVRLRPDAAAVRAAVAPR